MSEARRRKVERLLEKGMERAEHIMAKDVIRRGYSVTSAIWFMEPMYKLRIAMTEKLMAEHWPNGETK